MSNAPPPLQVLLVEDDPDSLRQLVRDLPEVFAQQGIEATLHPCDTFAAAKELTTDPSRRFDLIISDTYNGEVKNRDAKVMDIVRHFKEHRRFCPLLVFSSASVPSEFKPGPFTMWADKGTKDELENKLKEILQTGIPQAAQRLHADVDGTAGDYLWGFLDENWSSLQSVPRPMIEQIIRTRAAHHIQFSIPGEQGLQADREAHACEYYFYPSMVKGGFTQGDVVQALNGEGEIRVLLTPRCHLLKQPGQSAPRADYVLTVKTVGVEAASVERFKNAREAEPQKRDDKLRSWSRSPAQSGAKPVNRHWYLPNFLEIPHLFCDFMQLESIEYAALEKNYRAIATLRPPYSEALLACLGSFYGSVGIPEAELEGLRTLFPE